MLIIFTLNDELRGVFRKLVLPSFGGVGGGLRREDYWGWAFSSSSGSNNMAVQMQ